MNARARKRIPWPISQSGWGGNFPDFSDANLLDSIDINDLFIGINDGDVLPDLEMDMELLAEFSASGGEESEIMKFSTTSFVDRKAAEDAEDNYSNKGEDGQDKSSGGSAQSGTSTLSQGEEVGGSINESVVVNSIAPKEDDKGIRKLSNQSKNNHSQGKRKVKVDWIPELHQRFVQAVEQLGVDKAVPSRILELMGIDCLTRHNIASHLQKYQSHQKHHLAREAEAANWSQRRQMYGTGAVAVIGGSKREASPWPVPSTATIGFLPVTPMPTHFRPIHVWGHLTIDQSMESMWSPKHMTHSSSPPPPRVAPAWPPMAPHRPTPPPDAPYWPHPPWPMHECVDAAIGDALSKPWLPLPLGLKPPSIDGVMGELQRQGIPKIPPSCS